MCSIIFYNKPKNICFSLFLFFEIKYLLHFVLVAFDIRSILKQLQTELQQKIFTRCILTFRKLAEKNSKNPITLKLRFLSGTFTGLKFCDCRQVTQLTSFKKVLAKKISTTFTTPKKNFVEKVLLPLLKNREIFDFANGSVSRQNF